MISSQTPDGIPGVVRPTNPHEDHDAQQALGSAVDIAANRVGEAQRLRPDAVKAARRLQFGGEHGGFPGKVDGPDDTWRRVVVVARAEVRTPDGDTPHILEALHVQRCGTGGYGYEASGTQPIAVDQQAALKDQEFKGAAAAINRCGPASRHFQEKCVLARCGIAGQQASLTAVQLPGIDDGRRWDLVDPEELCDAAIGVGDHRLGSVEQSTAEAAGPLTLDSGLRGNDSGGGSRISRR